MTQRSFATHILARAKSPAAIAEMNGWREPDLFAAAESSLLSLVESVFGGAWHNGVIDSLLGDDILLNRGVKHHRLQNFHCLHSRGLTLQEEINLLS